MNEHKTRAEVDWVGTSLGATVKIALGRFTLAYFERRGLTWEEIRDNRDDLLPGSGFMSNSNMRDMTERVAAIVPDFVPYFNNLSTHSEGIGYALVHRARWTLKKDELARFRTTAWKPFFEMVRDAADQMRVITPDMRYNAHEQLIRQTVHNLPGVYVNVSADRMERFYLGESVDVNRRSKGHQNGPMYLTRVYVTQTKDTARQLQDALFHKLEETKLIKDRRIPDGAIGRQGALLMADGVHPVKVLDEIVATHYRWFCRAKMGALV